MEIPTYSSDKRRPTKFTEATKSVSFRLPESVAQHIKDKNWDLGQFIFNLITTGKMPTINNAAESDLLQQFVILMMNENIVAPEGFFTPTQTKTIMQIVESIPDGT